MTQKIEPIQFSWHTSAWWRNSRGVETGLLPLALRLLHHWLLSLRRKKSPENVQARHLHLRAQIYIRNTRKSTKSQANRGSRAKNVIDRSHAIVKSVTKEIVTRLSRGRRYEAPIHGDSVQEAVTGQEVAADHVIAAAVGIRSIYLFLDAANSMLRKSFKNPLNYTKILLFFVSFFTLWLNIFVKFLQ